VGFFDNLWEFLGERLGSWLALGVVSAAAVVAWLLFRYAVRLGQQFLCFINSRQRTLKAIGRETSRDGVREGNGVWLTKPIHQPDHYDTNIKANRILAIANLKGGVGKTTLTANLGAYYAKDRGLRVLLVDLDFQGSLSSMAFPAGDWIPPPGENSIATQLISNDLPPNLISRLARNVGLGDDTVTSGRLDVITAYYDLAQADNRVMVEWLLKCHQRVPKTWRETASDLILGKFFRTEDARYILAEMLHSRSVQSAYDLVIIDCPPRLTTSEIQAFCAASHLLIPTIMDRPSAEAVASLCQQIDTLQKNGICPHLQHVGIVGTMWQAGRAANGPAMQMIEDALARAGHPTGLLDETAFVRKAAALVNDADEGIAYIVMSNGGRQDEIRNSIGNLAEEIASTMGLPTKPRSFKPGASS
jgi:chromosome partitioning protein